MSVEITAKIICDGCGAVVDGPVQTKTSNGQQSYWRALDETKNRKWVRLLRYGTAKHYCAACADKPLPAKQKAKP